MKTLPYLCALLFFNLSYAQLAQKTIKVKYISEPVIIDAVLDESSWESAHPANDFWQYFPTDTLKAKQDTEIKMLFDDFNLYIGIKVFAAGNDFITPSLRRDFRASGSDNISLYFDTFNDGSNAFFFGTNPHGVLRESLISGGGLDISGFNTTWDTKWIGESKIHDDHYIVEWKIPLSAFKYQEGATKWRFNCYKFDTQDNERSSWVRVPQNQIIFNLAFMGDMIFEKPLGKSKSPVAVIPFVNGLAGKDYDSDKTYNDFKVGADAKLTVGNSLNLDLTVNPDFSQVEVDQQVTNLTRFEVSLPERRQFFIENSDVFSDFGDQRDARPFFSRRIGIAKDLEGNGIENTILGGVRLSGKLTNNLRMGFLNMQTDADLKNEIPTTNNAVVTLQQKVFSRSNLSFMFINKQATKDYNFLADEDRYNRVVGLDYRLASKDNTWTGKYFIHKSFSPGVQNKDISAGAATSFNSRNYKVRLSGVYIGDAFRSDLGFIRRTDIFKLNPTFQRNFYPIQGAIQSHSISVTPIVLWRPEYNFENSDYIIKTSWEANFNNTSSLQVTLNNIYTHLYNDFDPTGSSTGTPLAGNMDYRYSNIEANYRSNMRNKVSYMLSPAIGEFFNGKKYSMRAQVSWRVQPYFSSSIQVSYDRLKLPAPHPSASILLVGPRIDLTFSKKLFWATFIQYSNRSDNLSINTRLQWRFAPLSDLFIVYNDNYYTNDIFAPKVRSFNIKMSYWINL